MQNMNKIKLIKKYLFFIKKTLRLINEIAEKKIKGKKKTKNLKNNNRDVRAYARPHK